MKKAKIFYFTLQDEQTKEEKLEWFANTKFEAIPFDHITPDEKGNWINQTDNDFDELLPLLDKEVKAGKSQAAIFQLFFCHSYSSSSHSSSPSSQEGA